jgi:hypothetical protein
VRQIHRRAAAPALFLIFCIAVATQLARASDAQSTPYERTFTQSKATVEKTLKQSQLSSSGRLPVLDGFTSSGDRALDRFKRGYYQCAIQVSSTPSGGALVRVSAKITAWYEDPVPSKSGYQELLSNGRLETDFLDRLQDALSSKASSPAANLPASSAASPSKSKPVAPPSISAPMPGDGVVTGPSASSKASSIPDSSPFKVGNAASPDAVPSLATQKAVADKHMEELTKQAKGLEEILRNQAHPTNLVAVRKSATPVLVSPVEGAKVLFLATAEDEFEILDMNANWVHVRISGLSRGWIRRSNLEMPKPFAAEPKVENAPATVEQFQVKNEEIATFPGTWEPLQGKTVKIVTVQRATVGVSDTSSRAKLDFAKSVFDKEYAELTQAPSAAAGVVIIFDSEDGGMTAATLPVLKQWKSGSLSDQAFWRRCFFDPPETFISQTGQ